MNFSTPLLALLAANRSGDSSADAGRVALMSLLIKPPMMGLLAATVIAREARLVLEDPTVRRALKGLTRKDAGRLRQLENAVWDLHRAVDGVRDRLAFDGVARRKGGRVNNRNARVRRSVPATKRARAASRKRAG